MPFLQAGFNARHRRTGIFAFTVPAAPGPRRAPAPAELIQFVPSGEFAWVGTRRRFVAWPERCEFYGHRGLVGRTWPAPWYPKTELPA